MERDKNIFETASKQLGQGGQKQEPKKQKGPRSQRASPAPQAGYRDPEIAAMMKQVQDMKQDLQNKVESISKKSGLSYDDLKKAIDPKNFKPADLEVLKQKQEALKAKVMGAIGTPIASSGAAPKKRENVAGERKAKTLGVRKKWIPMR